MQESEFSKAVDAARRNVIDDHVVVIGEWTVLCPQDNWSEESDVNTSCSSSDSEAEENSTCVSSRSTHTVTFKVIGCTKESQYQQILQKARDLLEEGRTVTVKLSPEPDNPFDSKAIDFLCEVDEKFQRIGYVVKEVREAVHYGLIAVDIIEVAFKWVKFITDWYRCGPGYFAGINVTKRGVWPSVVFWARSTR